jgi:hypothetical protein
MLWEITLRISVSHSPCRYTELGSSRYCQKKGQLNAMVMTFLACPMGRLNLNKDSHGCAARGF